MTRITITLLGDVNMLPDRLKELRKANHRMTQADVANKLGVAKTTYASYEQGRRDPDISMLTKIASLFGVSVDYLLGHTTDKKPKKVDIDDSDVIMTYQGKPIPESDMEIIKRLLGGGRANE
jgi:transcriptional regulator with XRE-family HTH domain